MVRCENVKVTFEVDECEEIERQGHEITFALESLGSGTILFIDFLN